MNDEETVALIAGGHTVGKTHGAAPDTDVGPEPEGASLEEQGLGWRNPHGSGMGNDTITSGLEGIWTSTPNQWNNDFFKHLFEFEWELFQSPAGANQWRPSDGAGDGRVPDPHDPDSRHHPTFLTTDLALRFDPEYGKISRRFLENPAEFEDAFARAWFKLLHRDMGPNDRYLGPEVPDEDLIWQDPVPAGPQLSNDQIGALKGAILDTGLSVQQLVANRPLRRRSVARRTSGAVPTEPASGWRRRRTGR